MAIVAIYYRDLFALDLAEVDLVLEVLVMVLVVRVAGLLAGLLVILLAGLFVTLFTTGRANIIVPAAV